MILHKIETGNFKLDGGAMFGVVPKGIWERTNPADANNRIELAMRALLIESDKRLILIDTGIGNKQSEKFFSHYHLFGDYSLDKSLHDKGFHRDDITDIFLTHLHFDHAGGAIQWNKQKEHYEPAFKNATYWSNEAHWIWATQPNAREKASFLSENILPLEASGQLKFIDIRAPRDYYDELGFEILFVDGHTEKQMLPIVEYNGAKLVFAADLLPTQGHIPLPYVMGYDTRPLLTLQEKEVFLNHAADENLHLYFEHDVSHEVCTLQHTDRGVRVNETLLLKDLLAS